MSNWMPAPASSCKISCRDAGVAVGPDAAVARVGLDLHPGNRAVSTNLYFREKNFRIFMMRKFRLAELAHPEGWECKIFLVAKVLRE